MEFAIFTIGGYNKITTFLQALTGKKSTVLMLIPSYLSR